jgi:hypothetical protein
MPNRCFTTSIVGTTVRETKNRTDLIIAQPEPTKLWKKKWLVADLEHLLL